MPKKLNKLLTKLIHRHIQVKYIKIGMNEMRVNDSEISIR